jgi:hypothetical protein
VERSCDQSPKSFFVVEPGEGGKGIHVREGDRFTIPSGWLTISLDPSRSRGRLTRPGISWFATQQLAAGIPGQTDELEGFLKSYEEQADAVLKASENLSHLDLETEDGGREAVEMVTKDQGSADWWAMVMGAMAADLRSRLTSGEVAEAVLSACRMQAAHSILVFKEQLEPHVWTGYRHTRLIYDIAASGANTPQEAEMIQALRPAFSQLDEDVLHAWVESGADIGPKIGVTQVEEPLLKALAKYHLEAFERERKEGQLATENRARNRALFLTGVSAGAAVAGVVVAVLKATGVL